MKRLALPFLIGVLGCAHTPQQTNATVVVESVHESSDPEYNPAVLSQGTDRRTRNRRSIKNPVAVQDKVPRVMFWPGKVNQYFNLQTRAWHSDPSGAAGAPGNVDGRLAYCRRFYPNTTAVRRYTRETIYSWQAPGGFGAFEGTRWSYECVQPR